MLKQKTEHPVPTVKIEIPVDEFKHDASLKNWIKTCKGVNDCSTV